MVDGKTENEVRAKEGIDQLEWAQESMTENTVVEGRPVADPWLSLLPRASEIQDDQDPGVSCQQKSVSKSESLDQKGVVPGSRGGLGG